MHDDYMPEGRATPGGGKGNMSEVTIDALVDEVTASLEAMELAEQQRKAQQEQDFRDVHNGFVDRCGLTDLLGLFSVVTFDGNGGLEQSGEFEAKGHPFTCRIVTKGMVAVRGVPTYRHTLLLESAETSREEYSVEWGTAEGTGLPTVETVHRNIGEAVHNMLHSPPIPE